MSLLQYALDHDGAFPTGEKSPEASLSLVYPDYVDAETLRGKIIPLNTVKGILENGEQLGPDTCGWHYVDGLRIDDNPEIALCWDKVGLGHFGEEWPNGDHNVIFVDCNMKIITGIKWEAFLAEQEKLVKNRKPAIKKK